MKSKEILYDAILKFSDGDEDVYRALKKNVYEFTKAETFVKQRNLLSIISFFTNHHPEIKDALNLYIKENSIA